ncbi:MAG TPA: PEP-CTERM sorting domain-containing protein [Roseiarcus sp.]
MTLRLKALSTTALFLALGASAQADPTASSSLFATGGPVGGANPDSVTIGDGSLWIEYGNTADSTGAGGSSTIVRYGLNGAIQHTFSIAGEVDGLKVNPVTGVVWALQNQDGNATLSLINPTTNTVSSALSYASPPYVYGPNSARGYDDVAFLASKVYLSYTNPVNPTDSVLQVLNNGDNPTGTLTTTSILTAQQTGVPVPDTDSLKSTPGGGLVLTSEGDGAGTGNPVATFTLIANPGAANQTVTNVPVTDAMGTDAEAMDDVLFPGVTQGTLYVADTSGNNVYAIRLTGLDPGTPIISLGSLDEVATVNPVTGVVEQPLLTGIDAHGLDFIPFAVPEPSTWAMLLLGFAGLGFAGYRASAKRREALAG